MAYGILQAGQQDLDITEALARQAMGQEYQRNQLKARLEAKEDAERAQATGMGAGLGYRWGMSDAGQATMNDWFGLGDMPEGTGAAIDVGSISEPVTGGMGSAIDIGSMAEPTSGALGSTLDVGSLAKPVTTTATTAATEAASTAATTAATEAATGVATEAASAAGGASAGAELGSWAGPIGMVGGAVIGMALNDIF